MSDTDSQEVFLGRQPILDRQQQLFAYELLFRSTNAESGNFASFRDGTQATATVVANVFTEFSVADALGPYQGFIKVDDGFLFSDLIDALPPHAVVLELLESVVPTADVLARCAELNSRGFILAIREMPEAPGRQRPLLTLAEVIKIDISRFSPERLRLLVGELKPLGKTLLAEKVESSEQMQLCHELGFDLFQGYYFAHPTVISGKRLNTSELALLRLLSLLIQDADNAEVEKLFKQEPVLTVNLLRLTNSVGSGMTTRITSLRHAITVLGRQQLLRWLQLLLYTHASSAAPAANPLLQLAATRGRLMELLVEGMPAANGKDREYVDQAFMVGILSLMPTMLGAVMAEILAQLPVATRVQDALSERSGTLGELLSLIEALEGDDRARLDQALRHLPGISARLANSCLTQALAWANQLARDTP
jgi:c-di-GMP-related signal transduction protein